MRLTAPGGLLPLLSKHAGFLQGHRTTTPGASEVISAHTPEPRGFGNGKAAVSLGDQDAGPGARLGAGAAEPLCSVVRAGPGGPGHRGGGRRGHNATLPTVGLRKGQQPQGPARGLGQGRPKMGAGALPGHFLALSGLKKELGQHGATVLCSGLWAGARAKEGCANL